MKPFKLLGQPDIWVLPCPICGKAYQSRLPGLKLAPYMLGIVYRYTTVYKHEDKECIELGPVVGS